MQGNEDQNYNYNAAQPSQPGSSPAGGGHHGDGGKIWIILFGTVLIIGVIWFAVHSMNRDSASDTAPENASGQTAHSDQNAAASGNAANVDDIQAGTKKLAGTDTQTGTETQAAAAETNTADTANMETDQTAVNTQPATQSEETQTAAEQSEPAQSESTQPAQTQTADTSKTDETPDSTETGYSSNNGNAFYGIWCKASKKLAAAQKYAKEMEEKGFTCEVFLTSEWSGLNQDDWYVVSAGVYSSKAEAKKYLKAVQADQPDAYVKYSGDYQK